MRIVFFSFYFPPDLGAGSFRTNALCQSIKEKLNHDDELHVISSHPNRYRNHFSKADNLEIDRNITIHRIIVPSHNGKMLTQIVTFMVFAFNAIKICRKLKPDFLIGTSSRLMTAFLTFFCSYVQKIKFYIDLRDIFSETISDLWLVKNRFFGLFLRYLFQNIEKKILKSASGVNLVSEGFIDYFKNFGINTSEWTYFTNGVDNEFRNIALNHNYKKNKVKTILYAGNIGDGQGLEKIIPGILNNLDSKYRFLIIGDGSSLGLLKQSIPSSKSSNIEFIPPIPRAELIKYYIEADILFLHLNNIPAFKRVLPSKIFEYGALGKPIIAGVTGYPREFIKENIPYASIIKPGDYKGATKNILETSNIQISETTVSRFNQKFSRELIMNEMATKIINVIQQTNA